MYMEQKKDTSKKPLRLYNTLSRKLDILKPIKKNLVRIYSCGPTVYNFAQIGNLRAYIFTDTLIRSLVYLGYPIRHAMNITDVGHLTSDADEGEDKMDVSARREKKDPLKIAREYEKAFFADIQKLNIIQPKKIKRATQTIRQQQAIIRLLEKQGYTYTTDKAVYFDISKFKKYGTLSGQKLDAKKNLSREDLVSDPYKKHPQDFALWLFTKGKHARHILRWPSPWGEGFPGWHIECSAISRSLLGQPFDIHTGGVDHIGVHHENEIAQSVAAFHTPLARIWMHNEHLLVDGKKMGKSLGNAYTLLDIIKKDVDPIGFRYFCLQAHYRTVLNFTWEGLGAAQNALHALQKLARAVYIGEPVQSSCTIFNGYQKKFHDACANDLGTPQALAVAWGTAKDPRLSQPDKKTLLMDFDRVLGLMLCDKKNSIPAHILHLAKKREVFRRNKQFIQADALRKKIQRVGYTIDDAPKGTYLTKTN